MQLLQRSVLVLNNAYEPVNITTVQRAMRLVCKGAAVVQDASAFFLRSQRVAYPLPSVVRLLSYRRPPRQPRGASRRHIFMRDGYACQYCGKSLAAGGLTLDHVIPKSRGGKSTWENLVACCHPCNNRKGDRTPAEAGLTLAKTPARFGLHAKHRMMARGHEGWELYLFA